jgi:hypothetical protein
VIRESDVGVMMETPLLALLGDGETNPIKERLECFEQIYLFCTPVLRSGRGAGCEGRYHVLSFKHEHDPSAMKRS